MKVLDFIKVSIQFFKKPAPNLLNNLLFNNFYSKSFAIMSLGTLGLAFSILPMTATAITPSANHPIHSINSENSDNSALQNYSKNCQPIKVLVKDLQNGGTNYGNGFAISPTEVIVNDHTLPAQVGSIELQFEHSEDSKKIIKISAQLSVRDFHTDLALLKISANNSLPVCQLESNPNQNSLSNLVLMGFDKQDFSSSALLVQIQNWQSKKSTVPGLTEAIEIGAVNIRESFSGSVLLNANGNIIGMTSQKTAEGSALLIPAKTIQQIALNLRVQGNNPQLQQKTNLIRPYELDRSSNMIQFKGLKIDLNNSSPLNYEKSNSGSGSGTNPHKSNSGSGSGTNPHLGPLGQNNLDKKLSSPYFVSFQDYDIGYAVASVADAKEFQKWSPEIYNVMLNSAVSKIYISSIDKTRIRSNIDFIRVITMCTKCEIDGFWIQAKNPKALSNNILKIQANLVSLISYLDDNNQSPPEIDSKNNSRNDSVIDTQFQIKRQNESMYLKGLFEKLNELNMTLTRIYLDQQKGQSNPQLIKATKISLLNLKQMIFAKYSQTSILPDILQDILSDLEVAASDLGY